MVTSPAMQSSCWLWWGRNSAGCWGRGGWRPECDRCPSRIWHRDQRVSGQQGRLLSHLQRPQDRLRVPLSWRLPASGQAQMWRWFPSPWPFPWKKRGVKASASVFPSVKWVQVPFPPHRAGRRPGAWASCLQLGPWGALAFGLWGLIIKKEISADATLPSWLCPEVNGEIVVTVRDDAWPFSRFPWSGTSRSQSRGPGFDPWSRS